ncbi:hypothetical protein [Streptomyces sp. x-80]|uniref:hypothetical protein n=1 Tax=Streptomyces sp. x-80 TaxID=2789282 RepID=UPI00397F0883
MQTAGARIGALLGPAAGTGLLAAGASAGAPRDSLVAAALLVLHGVAQLWPRFRERPKGRN